MTRVVGLRMSQNRNAHLYLLFDVLLESEVEDCRFGKTEAATEGISGQTPLSDPSTPPSPTPS